jgi:hypothetical protein
MDLQKFAAAETLQLEWSGNPSTLSPTVLAERNMGPMAQFRERERVIREYGLEILEEATRLGSFHYLREALQFGTGKYSRLMEYMSPADFPKLFADTIDRVLLGSYREYPSSWRAYLKTGKVRDFRTVKRFAVDGADDQLQKVDQMTGYQMAALNERDWSYKVDKYGKRFGIGWETIINDDLGALKDIPERFGRAARRTENKFAASLWVNNATLFSAPNGNKITKGLSVPGLQTAMTTFSKLRDPQGEPIAISGFHLVVSQGQEIVAQNILNALSIEITEAGGTANQKVIAQNWMKARFTLHVEPYIDILDPVNGATSWAVFANPSDVAAVEVGFLNGHEVPQTFVKSPNSTLIGAGSGAMVGDFEDDSIAYKVRHVLGGTQLDYRGAVYSDGTTA